MTISKRPNDEIIEVLNTQFKYEPEVGNLYRLDRRCGSWRLVKIQQGLCNLFSDKTAKFNSPQVSISTDRNYFISAAAICWYKYYGEWPTKEIDHINTNPCDNRITNLRLSNRSAQMLNRAGYKKRKYLFGAYYRTARKHLPTPWASYIRYNNKQRYLGHYKTELEAHLAYTDRYIDVYKELPPRELLCLPFSLKSPDDIAEVQKAIRTYINRNFVHIVVS